MKIKKITALILVLLLSLPQGIAFAQTSAENQAETSFNFDEYEAYGSAYLDKPNTKWRGKELIDRVDY